MTSHRLLSSTERKNHICHCMTSDAALEFSSCPNNTPPHPPPIGLRWFWRNPRSRSGWRFLCCHTTTGCREHPSTVFLPRVLQHMSQCEISKDRHYYQLRWRGKMFKQEYVGFNVTTSPERAQDCNGIRV